jgi:S1-C subfamily serine protease
MQNESRINVTRRRFGIKNVLAYGLPFFAAGVLITSGMQWTRPSLAEDFSSGSHVSLPAPATMPNSFAELADTLSPTVVNVKVTKIETAAFPGPQGPQGPQWRFFQRFFQRNAPDAQKPPDPGCRIRGHHQR